MLTTIKSIAAAAVIATTLAATAVQARHVESDAPKARQAVAQKLAKAQAPYFFLVLGVGY